MTQTWPDIRAATAAMFGGQQPGPALEAELVTAFEHHPSLFSTEASRTAADLAAGRIHSPWPILHRRLNERTAAEDRYATVTATDAREREQAIRLAERRIRHIAATLETEADVIAELFAPPQLTADVDTLERIVALTEGTPLHALAQAQLEQTRRRGRTTVDGTAGILSKYDNEDLRHRMLELWRTLTPEPHPDSDLDTIFGT